MSYSATPKSAVLAAAIDARADEALLVSSGFPSGRGIVVQIDDELISVDLAGDSDLRYLTRGFYGTAPAAHAQNAVVTVMAEDSLATTGTWGDGTHVPRLTVDEEGRVRAAAAVEIAFPAVPPVSLPTATPPATADATGVAGQVVVASDFVYFCVATDTWVRAAVATWVPEA